MTTQTVTLGGHKFVILAKKEYDRLRTLARGTTDEDGWPAFPKADAEGNLPAVQFARVSLARKIIRRRRAAGLTQVELARRAGIRPESLNRIERAKVSADVGTVEKIVRAIEKAESEEAR